jgi:diketogulonate reductase-like aldo/keto reductase
VKTKTFGATGVPLPVVGQGTWQMESDDRQSAVRALRRGIELGMTHIDTAELYGSGRVEDKIVSEAIAGRRDDLFLVSKVLPSNASRRGTIQACERSLRRLRTDRLDLYLLHWPGNHALAETIAAFQELVERKLIRFFGVSNFDVRELEQAVTIAGAGAIACNQVLYHLQERAMERRVLPACEAHGIAVVGYSPFGSGNFPRAQTPGGRVLAEIARTHEVSPHAVALAFLLRRPSLFTIPKASTAEHVEHNAKGDLDLSEAEIAAIDEAFPVGDSGSLPTL